MLRKYFLSTLIFIFTFPLTLVPLTAQEKEGEIIIISDRVGKEIDLEERDPDTAYREPGPAFFLELIGKPYTSINIDLRINKSSRFSLGIMLYTEYKEAEDKNVNSFMPNIMYYYLIGDKNKRLEIGGGIGVRPVWHKDIDGDFPLAFHGVIGYRYQKKDGLLFRIGFTPSIYPEVFLPFIGISFGYSL